MYIHIFGLKFCSHVSPENYFIHVECMFEYDPYSFKVQEAWILGPFSHMWDQFRWLDFFDAVCFLALLEDSTSLRFFGMLTWCIWNDINKWVFDKMCKGPEKLLAEVLGYLEAFNAFHVRMESQRSSISGLGSSFAWVA